MTGFASTEHPFQGGSVVCELKSVNSRFLDLSFRLPEEMRSFESMLREKITAFVRRGKVECRLTILHNHQDTLDQVLPKESVLRRLHDWQTDVLKLHPNASPLSVADLLRWPGVLEQNGTDHQRLSAALQACVQDCLEQLTESRQREGSKLASILIDRCASVTALIQQLQPKLPSIRATYQNKAVEKFSEALGMIAPQSNNTMSKEEVAQRLCAEIAAYALRVDVDEELERLKTHLKEVERVLTQLNSQGIGKRLDFLMQELHREANTLGSKALTLDVSQTAMEIKLLIEQMREQVQNIE
jgi:uncharacterized protein (TIGR00255 family)